MEINQFLHGKYSFLRQVQVYAGGFAFLSSLCTLCFEGGALSGLMSLTPTPLQQDVI
jgi:hypothetical protein